MCISCNKASFMLNGHQITITAKRQQTISINRIQNVLSVSSKKMRKLTNLWQNLQVGLTRHSSLQKLLSLDQTPKSEFLDQLQHQHPARTNQGHHFPHQSYADWIALTTWNNSHIVIYFSEIQIKKNHDKKNPSADTRADKSITMNINSEPPHSSETSWWTQKRRNQNQHHEQKVLCPR